MFATCTCLVLVAMTLVLVRGIKGPTLYDRMLAVNSFGTKTVILIALYGFLIDRPDFLDISLVYATINFVSTIAVLKFSEYGDLGGFWSKRRRGSG